MAHLHKAPVLRLESCHLVALYVESHLEPSRRRLDLFDAHAPGR